MRLLYFFAAQPPNRMKSLLYAILVLVTVRLSASDPEKQTRMPMIKVYKNDLEKVYTVFFADTLVRTVKVSLQDKRGATLIEESFTAKGFSKPFGLTELKNGEYEFVISYDGTSVTEPIALRSEKEIMDASITLKRDYPTLMVNVSSYNMNPMNIFIYDNYDKLLKMLYWEPNDRMMTKNIDMSQFDGYEIRVQIVQDGIDKLEQLVPLY
jgi:hypothetical protein